MTFMSFGHQLSIAAARDPDRVFLHDMGQGTTFTFQQVHDRAFRVAAFFNSSTERPRRVAVLSVDNHQYVETVLGCMAAGATVLPLNPRLRVSTIGALLRAAAVTDLFYSGRYEDIASTLVDTVPTLDSVVAFDPSERFTDVESVLAAHPPMARAVAVGSEDIASISFTSGTTGEPKGVLQSQRMLKSIAASMLAETRLIETDRWYCASPLFHVSGLCQMLMCVSRGAQLVLDAGYSSQNTLTRIQEGQITGCWLAPTMMEEIVTLQESSDQPPASLRLLAYGGAPMLPSLLGRAQILDCDFVQFYGSGTEAGNQAVLTVEDHIEAVNGRTELLSSVGRRALSCEVAVLDPAGDEVEPGVVGEIAARGETLMSGYLEDGDTGLNGDGWFLTGDLAVVDESGYLHLAGRKKDIIIRGGENISAAAVEQVVSAFSDVRAVAVVGEPDDRWGEIVVCHLVVDGDRPSVEELVVHCKRTLASYQVPADWVFASSLPTSESGKIDKAELRRRRVIGVAHA
jgi:acyl-CoA synthetase (AMP-forming)/AMP-acid ligase II